MSAPVNTGASVFVPRTETNASENGIVEDNGIAEEREQTNTTPSPPVARTPLYGIAEENGIAEERTDATPYPPIARTPMYGVAEKNGIAEERKQTDTTSSPSVKGVPMCFGTFSPTPTPNPGVGRRLAVSPLPTIPPQNGIVEERKQTDTTSSPSVKGVPMCFGTFSPTPTRNPGVGRRLDVSPLPTIPGNQLHNRSLLQTGPYPHNPDMNRVPAGPFQPAFGPLPSPQWLHEHTPCMQRSNNLEARAKAAENELSKTREVLFKIQRDLVKLQGAYAGAQEELGKRRIQQGSGQLPDTPPPAKAGLGEPFRYPEA